MDQKSNKSSEEIDLVHLFNRFVIFFIRSIKIYSGILWNNAFLFISIFVIISMIGFSCRYFIPRYFKTQAVFVAHYMPTNMYVLLLDDLSNLAKSNDNTNIVAEQLKISEKSAATIHAIETQPLNNQDFQYKNDTISVNAFRINLVLTDIVALKDVENGLKNFLENNEYSIKRKNAKRKALELMRADLVQKRKSLDSIQQLLNKSASSQGSGQVVILAQSFMPLEAYKILQDYNNRQIQIEQDLDMIENIEIVQPFIKINVPNSPDFKRIFLISLLVGIVLSFVLTPLFGKR